MRFPRHLPKNKLLDPLFSLFLLAEKYLSLEQSWEPHMGTVDSVPLVLFFYRREKKKKTILCEF